MAGFGIKPSGSLVPPLQKLSVPYFEIENPKHVLHFACFMIYNDSNAFTLVICWGMQDQKALEQI
jgi:hypothetical protein